IQTKGTGSMLSGLRDRVELTKMRSKPSSADKNMPDCFPRVKKPDATSEPKKVTIQPIEKKNTADTVRRKIVPPVTKPTPPIVKQKPVTKPPETRKSVAPPVVKAKEIQPKPDSLNKKVIAPKIIQTAPADQSGIFEKMRARKNTE